MDSGRGDRGRGRIIGEVCHFVDFFTFLNGSLPVRVHAQALKDACNLHDVVNISLAYENGSIGTISYLANGDKGLPKERVEIFAHGCTAVLDDFKSLTLYAGGKKKSKNFFSQDKGQKTELDVFLDAIQNGKGLPIRFEEMYSASLVTFKILESLRTGQVISL